MIISVFNLRGLIFMFLVCTCSQGSSFRLLSLFLCFLLLSQFFLPLNLFRVRVLVLRCPALDSVQTVIVHGPPVTNMSMRDTDLYICIAHTDVYIEIFYCDVCRYTFRV